MPRVPDNTGDLPDKITVDALAEMEAHDKLPPLLRAFIRESVFPWSSLQILELLPKIPATELLRRMKEQETEMLKKEKPNGK